MHRSRIQLILSCMLLITGVPILSARPQAGDNTAEAKQHYQSAVAAISKSDWATAKAELLQAEKLAPQNALVHYDLALAYSHTGSPKSAQAELNKAIQLGLPAEQKHAAEQLKEQLANTPVKATAGQNKSHDPLATLIHQLNALMLNDVAVMSAAYWPEGFTFEKSTGKLWWTRAGQSNCGSGSVKRAKVAARISDIDTGSIRLASQYDQPDGKIITENVIVYPCRKDDSGKRTSCLEWWEAPFCESTSINTRSPAPDSVEVMDKSASQRIIDDRGNPIRTENSMFGFSYRTDSLAISTTGDPQATEQAVLLLQKIVAKAGGQQAPQVSNVEEATRKATQDAAEEAERTKRASQAVEEAAKAAKDREEAAKQSEKMAADRDKLSQLQGTWRGTWGEKRNATGTFHGTVYTQPITGTVNVVEFYDYDLVLNGPSGAGMSGQYSYGNRTWKLAASPLIGEVNDCFNAGGNCYTAYSWNKTQIFDASVSVADDGSIQVKLTHQACQGECTESAKHLADRSGSIEIVTPFIMRLTVGGSTYKLTKQ